LNFFLNKSIIGRHVCFCAPAVTGFAVAAKFTVSKNKMILL